MSTIQAGFGPTLTRASVLPLSIFAAVAAYLVPTQLFADHTIQVPQQQESAVIWKADYSERFPGCVASVLWPADETPIAVVVLSTDGTAFRVSREEARQRAVLGVRTIGACRTPE
ncbi:MAG TPA: hypothetical protein VLI04_07995 [Nocardioidaceae bacterium]|nr:hypothetical protein [Nocardioidaceae bacterium]